MAALKTHMSRAERVNRLLLQAEDNYLRHFAEPVVPGSKPTKEQIDAAVFGYLSGMILFNENADLNELCYEAMQKRFGWDDEYIAVQVIGG